MTRMTFQLAGISALLLAMGTAVAEEKKEPTAKSREAAKLLKDNVSKFGLTISGFFKGHPTLSLVTDKELAKRAPRVTLVISEAQARALIDALVEVGQFDKPQHIPPPGIPVPGWYLYVGLIETPPRTQQWMFGDDKYDLTTDPIVSELIKVLEGDAKKALQKLAKDTAK